MAVALPVTSGAGTQGEGQVRRLRCGGSTGPAERAALLAHVPRSRVALRAACWWVLQETVGTGTPDDVAAALRLQVQGEGIAVRPLSLNSTEDKRVLVDKTYQAL